jgi:hypothetical protein
MLMGAFATKAHFAEMARFIADTSGHEVCIYDHRGVNRSGPPRLEAQTAAQLAADALVVADTLWGPGTPVHVYGCVFAGTGTALNAVKLALERARDGFGTRRQCWHLLVGCDGWHSTAAAQLFPVTAQASCDTHHSPAVCCA